LGAINDSAGLGQPYPAGGKLWQQAFKSFWGGLNYKVLARITLSAVKQLKPGQEKYSS
jgi:hypothetical protein